MRPLTAVVCAALGGLWLVGPLHGQGKDAGMIAAEGKALYMSLGCSTCHGEDGRTPREKTFPVIAGQSSHYSYMAMRAYQTGDRKMFGGFPHGEANKSLDNRKFHPLADSLATLK